MVTLEGVAFISCSVARADIYISILIRSSILSFWWYVIKLIELEIYILLVGMSFLQKTRRKSIGIVIPNFLRVENMLSIEMGGDRSFLGIS